MIAPRALTKVEREKLWGEIIARRLLSDAAAGKISELGVGEIGAACDEAIKRIIGKVDRARLIDETSRQVVELASAPPRQAETPQSAEKPPPPGDGDDG